ncbi:MAG TPA: sugar phosphate nucleotidyltransferase [Longilinea sp.]|nr:sugar phosphate nucleotidyltransferase [Longilinea sp.]
MAENMTIAIPMAGYGTRMRPHTWSKAKPLIHLAGKTVLDYVLAQFDTLPGIEQAEWVFIVSPFQLEQVQAFMKEHHPQLSAHYVVQTEMRGQSDALYLAREYLQGPMLMAFSDTLIEIDLAFLSKLDCDGVTVVKQVPDPRRFGVAQVDADGRVTHLVEKPQDVSNNLALVGFYYFRSGAALMKAIEEQKQRNITLKGEYFLADSVNVMLEHGSRWRTHEVQTWLDAGTRDSLLETNAYLLDHGHDNSTEAAKRPGVTIIPPVYIPDDAKVESCVLGPHVSLGHNVELDHVLARDTIIEDGTHASHLDLEHSHLGRDVQASGHAATLNLGDDSIVQQ